MARRKDHSREEIKSLVIQAGLALLYENGLTSLTARAVAKKIGYTVGTLYNVFKNFDEIVLHLNADTLSKMTTVLGAEKDIFRLTEIYIQFSHQHDSAWRLLFEFNHHHQDVPLWYNQKIEALFKLVENALLPYVNHSQTQAAMTAKVLWASLYGICYLSLNGKLTTILGESAQTIGKSLVENYLAGAVRQQNLLQT